MIPTESETLFNVITLNRTNTEKVLMIYIKAARVAYDEGIIDDIIWIRRNYNLADAMRKATTSQDFAGNLEKGKYSTGFNVQSLELRLPTTRERKRRSVTTMKHNRLTLVQCYKHGTLMHGTKVRVISDKLHARTARQV